MGPPRDFADTASQETRMAEKKTHHIHRLGVRVRKQVTLHRRVFITFRVCLHRDDAVNNENDACTSVKLLCVKKEGTTLLLR